MGIYTSLNDEMACPLCGETNTHVDRVAMTGRDPGEDGATVELGILANGAIVDATGKVPPSRHVGVGRRHRIALIGCCEHCEGEFALLFTQHKGVTLVETVDLGHVAQEAS